MDELIYAVGGAVIVIGVLGFLLVALGYGLWILGGIVVWANQRRWGAARLGKVWRWCCDPGQDDDPHDSTWTTQ